MAEQPTIFLCHAKEDKAQVFDVYDKLKNAGLKPWLDKLDLLPGQYWDQEIRKALRSARFIMIFFSTNAVNKRGYVQREFKLALEVLEEIPDDQIFIIPVRLDDCEVPERFRHIQYCDLFEKGEFERVLQAIRTQYPELPTVAELKEEKIASPKPKIKLRATPIDNLEGDAVKQMLQEKGFYDSNKNKPAAGFTHDYQLLNNGQVVHDRNSGLMWQQGGSSNWMKYEDAQKYIEQLNREKFAGYNDWRLPTLEEAMSLMERERKNGDLYIDPVFDAKQRWIWTADRHSASRAWFVFFLNGYCGHYDVDGNYYARAVRS